MSGGRATATPGRATLLVTLGQRLRVDRAKHRTAARIDHRHHDLRTARCVEHDPIESGAGAGDVTRSPIAAVSTTRAYRAPAARALSNRRHRRQTASPIEAHFGLSPIWLERDHCSGRTIDVASAEAVKRMIRCDRTRARRPGEPPDHRRDLAAGGGRATYTPLVSRRADRSRCRRIPRRRHRWPRTATSRPARTTSDAGGNGRSTRKAAGFSGNSSPGSPLTPNRPHGHLAVHACFGDDGIVPTWVRAAGCRAHANAARFPFVQMQTSKFGDAWHAPQRRVVFLGFKSSSKHWFALRTCNRTGVRVWLAL